MQWLTVCLNIGVSCRSRKTGCCPIAIILLMQQVSLVNPGLSYVFFFSRVCLYIK